MADGSSVRSLGAAPVSAAQPAGVNPREGANFAALQDQIDRLTNLHAGQPVEWPVVARLAAKVLQEEGKDLAVGTWLTVALFRQEGLNGLADGIRVLRDLVETWWEAMSPPAKRLRGRRNQMQWLLDQLTDALDEAFISQVEPMPATRHAEMLADWDALDAAWQTHDDEAPAFYGLAAMLRRLPVQDDAGPLSAPAEAPGASVEVSEVAVTAPVALLPDSHASAVASGHATHQGAAPSSAAPAAAAVTIPESAAVDAATAFESALASLHPLVTWMVQEHPTAPVLFRLNRICAWAALEQCPPAQGRSTRLPSPAQAFEAYEQVIEGGDPLSIIRFAESRLVSQPYWLDLNRVCHAALMQLNAGSAAAVLAAETAHFLARMPGLAELTYSDGRPLADAATRAWIEALQRSSEAPTGGGTDSVDALAREAETEAVAGRLNDALDQLQDAVRTARGGRDGFRLRLAQCSLIHRFDAKTDIRPMVATLIEEAESCRLASWEPDLARQAFELAAGVELRHGRDGASPHVPMLGRLSRLDVNAAWQLSQTNAD